MADIFTKKQADSVYQNSLPKALRTIFSIQKVNENIPNTKPPTIENIQANTEKVMETEQIQRWITKVESLNGLFTDATNRKNELLLQLSNVDKELAVLDHYVEFQKLNACQHCKSDVMRQKRLKIRRLIKNELSVLNIILSEKIGEVAVDKINRCIKGLDNRTYNPKALKELFDL